ncbi:hypothetical protein DYB32_009253 [Aphanomyces invadans]|uniref:EGF-like domain-containing protein n=1 Tax=Aphanomyces invadans TaxID=157072 RepID=A0A3R6YZD9_9STRA|nr:hypothetical protein DYB32_009253 [Aphanomyces invadans]
MNDTMYWPPLYTKSPPIWDDTQDGYRRAGTWSYKAPTQWQKGTCLVQFARTCPSSASPIVSVDPDATFRPIVQYSAVNATRVLSYEGCDTCECTTWPSVWRDGRHNGGTPIFHLPDGSPQLTGYSKPALDRRPHDSCGCRWTGYDCNTPICTQAKRFVLNSIRDTPSFVAMRGALHKLPCVHLRCPQYDIEVTSNDGTSFQSGCAPGIPFPNPVFAGTLAEKQSNWDAYNDTATTGRQSASALCRVLQWRQGEFSHRLVVAFENDPCGTQGGRWGKEVYNGAEMGQGNCTLPYLCTCLCRVRYDVDECKKTGEFCLKPWSDVFGRAIPAGFIFGTKHCSSGFQGLEDDQGRFQSCHLQIYEPTEFQRYTASFVAFMTIACILFMVSFYCIRRNIKRRKLLLKAERRRSRRESEENPLNPEFAFGHAQ